MKQLLFILSFGISAASIAEEAPFRFPLETAQKIGSPHANQIPGRVIGSAEGPFASVAAIRADDKGMVSIETRAGKRLHIASGRPKAGHDVRIEFFLNPSGESIAVQHETKRPDAPEPERDERPYEHRSLCEAASFAIARGNVALLPPLIKAGLDLDLPLDLGTGWTALHYASLYNQPRVAQLLIDHGADLDVRSKYDERAIDMAVEKGESDLCPILSKPAEDERLKAGYAVPMIDELLFIGESKGVENQVRFVSLNGEDPPKELMSYIGRHWHDALPRSSAEELNELPGDAPTSYRDKKSGKFGEVVELTLKKESDAEFGWRLRTATGPFLAGGGVAGRISKQFGYWIKTIDESWDE
jgi:hypothetical protein